MTIPAQTLPSIGEWSQVDLALLGLGLVGVFGAIWLVYLIVERDAKQAASRTSRAAGGTLLGAGGVATVAAAEGLQVIAEAPGVVIGLIGLGSIIGGISWEVYSAIALTGYIVLVAIRGE